MLDLILFFFSKSFLELLPVSNFIIWKSFWKTDFHKQLPHTQNQPKNPKPTEPFLEKYAPHHHAGTKLRALTSDISFLLFFNNMPSVTLTVWKGDSFNNNVAYSSRLKMGQLISLEQIELQTHRAPQYQRGSTSYATASPSNSLNHIHIHNYNTLFWMDSK